MISLTSTRDQQPIAQSRRLRIAAWPTRDSLRFRGSRPLLRLQRLCWTDPSMHRAPRTVGSTRVRMEAWRSAVHFSVGGKSSGARQAGSELIHQRRQHCSWRNGLDARCWHSIDGRGSLLKLFLRPSRGPPRWPLTTKAFSWKRRWSLKLSDQRDRPLQGENTDNMMGGWLVR